MRELSRAGKEARNGVSRLIVDPNGVALAPGRIVVGHTADRGYFCVALGSTARLLQLAEDEGAVAKLDAIRVPETPSVFRPDDDPFLRRLEIIVALTKDGFDPAQVRDARGRWAGVGATVATAAVDFFDGELAPSIVSALGTLASGLSAPTLFLSTLFIPTNRSLVSEGPLPEAPDVAYHYDQGTGVLSLTRIGDDGTTTSLFEGRADAEGLFHDSDGNVVGRHLGGSVMVDPDAVPGYRSRSNADEQSSAGATAQTDATADRDTPKLCPDPVPDRPSTANVSERSKAYQEQISGLPRGLAVELNSVSFDGCRLSDGTMLEAKGMGFLWAMTSPNTWRKNYDGVLEIMTQAQNQVIAAPSRNIEWHFAEEPVADYFRVQFLDAGYSNITVFYTPPTESTVQ